MECFVSQPHCMQIVVLTWRKNCHQIISFCFEQQLQDVISFVFCSVALNLYVVCLNLSADVNPQHNTFANKQRILEVRNITTRLRIAYCLWIKSLQVLSTNFWFMCVPEGYHFHQCQKGFKCHQICIKMLGLIKYYTLTNLYNTVQNAITKLRCLL